jgi:transposase
MNWGEAIDQMILQDSEKRIGSVGQAVKAMGLNGLGFVDQRLYLIPHFFQDKPTQRLIGAGIGPEHLNDDVTGRALEKLYELDAEALSDEALLAVYKVQQQVERGFRFLKDPLVSRLLALFEIPSRGVCWKTPSCYEKGRT